MEEKVKTEKLFNINTLKESIGFGWKTVKDDFWWFVGLSAIIIFSGLFLEYMVEYYDKRDVVVMQFLASLGVFFVQLVMSLGIMKISLAYRDGKKSRYGELFSQSHLFLRFLGATILYTLIVAGGFLLLIIPGIIWAIRYQYFGYFIVDKNAGIKESLRKSAIITENEKWHLFCFGMVLGFINLLGAFALGVGLFVTIPVSYIAMAFVYRRLCSKLPNK